MDRLDVVKRCWLMQLLAYIYLNMPYDAELFLIEIILKLQELGVPFISISAPSIVSGMSGESEKTLREAFEEAQVRFPFKGLHAV